MKEENYILNNETEVLNFLKSHYPMYHLSNIFFRDVQYGIRLLLERRGARVSYTEAEEIARSFVQQLERKRILRPIDRQSWVLNYPEFRKPPSKPAAPAKPAAAAPAAPRPAGGLPPLKSGTPAGGLPPLKSAAPAAKPGTLPPLKSSAPAAGAKPAGLPPLKSSAPVSGTKPARAEATPPAPPGPAAAAQPEVKPDASPSPAAPPPAASSSGATVAPMGKKPLPPIKSSVPAGAKK